MKIDVAILGATGYTGAELIRLIDAHPHFRIAHLAAHSQAGRLAGEVLPGLGGATAATMLAASDAPLPDSVQLAFAALPHGAAAASVAKALGGGIKVVDLSADFRHASADTFRAAYDTEHPHPDLLPQAVYGLSEFAREAIAGARLVANPGCYPTSALLPLVPLLKTGHLETKGVIVDAKSGTSGAGRSTKTELLFCEVNEGLRAYAMPRHRHAWEMEEWASAYAGREMSVRFVPHILPMTRGMLTTLHLNGAHPQTWHQALSEAFAGERFVRVLPEGQLPSTHGVRGSNRCDIGLCVTGEDSAVVVSCIDNLLKGAAGQALQNANLMFALDEAAGLPLHAVWP
jgi:N-acetyl-gamma-glutamyl-phosphate reductase